MHLKSDLKNHNLGLLPRNHHFAKILSSISPLRYLKQGTTISVQTNKNRKQIYWQQNKKDLRGTK